MGMNANFHQWCKVLAYLYDHDNECIAGFVISKETGVNSTSSITLITKLLEEKNLVRIERIGRVNKYVLTEKGRLAGEYFIRLFAILNGA